MLKTRVLWTITNFRQLFIFCMGLEHFLRVSKTRQLQVSHAGLEGTRLNVGTQQLMKFSKEMRLYSSFLLGEIIKK